MDKELVELQRVHWKELTVPWVKDCKMNHSGLFKSITSTIKNLPLSEGFKLTAFSYYSKFNYNYIITVQLQDHVSYVHYAENHLRHS